MSLKGYKIRLYPTKEQEEKIWKHINGCRFIWNYMLELQIKNHEAGNKQIKNNDLIKLIPQMKKTEEYAWLSELSNGSMQATIGKLTDAYSRFFSNIAGYPKYKSKKSAKKSYQIRSDCMYFKENTVFIQKIGHVRYKSDFVFKTGPNIKHYNIRLHFRNNKYILTFTMESENQATTCKSGSMGIDLGVKELATVAFNDECFVFHNINKSKRMKTLDKRIRTIQRSISRKYKEAKKKTGRFEKSNNIIKQEETLRKLRNKVTNIRLNYIHQTTRFLVNKNPERIVMEGLDVAHMLKDKHLRKQIQDQNFSEIFRQMEYKCQSAHIDLVKADRYFPSSKLCSSCNHLKPELKLSDRIYTCQYCGLRIDRDYNAAINLMKYMTQTEES